ncbi:slipin family protein [candidate division KSB1 bacterium]|nr:slipin family protein [candidate division KSB1 bacterium]
MLQNMTLTVLSLFLIYLIFRVTMRKCTVFEFEQGLKYRNGKFVKKLTAGRYYYNRFRAVVHKFDLRPGFLTLAGQEVLTADGISLKISITAGYKIIDAKKAMENSTGYQQALYFMLQISLRDIVGHKTVQDLLENRGEISRALFESCAGKSGSLGLELLSADVRDIMFPGQLKEIFSQVAKARQAGLAALEKARGETAALRHLANAAKLLDDNPSLMQLRMVQSLMDSSGHTIVFNSSNMPQIVPVNKK